MKVDIIDPHIHLFDLQEGDYAWLKAENEPAWPDKSKIAQNYSDADIQKQDLFNVAGYVHIEAGFDNNNGHREIANVSKKATLTQRSIGYIDITLAPTHFMFALAAQAQHKSAVGIRYILEQPVLEDNSRLAALENENSYINLAFLASQNGIFELQFDLKKREHAIQVYTFLKRLPNLKVVLNHAGFPPLAVDSDNNVNLGFEDWKINIHLLAQLPNIAVKCSGFEMIDRAYSAQHIKAVVAHCIDAFGLDNVMLASNFPLCELSLSYESYWLQLLDIADQLAKDHISRPNKKALCYDNAFRIYGFDKMEIADR